MKHLRIAPLAAIVALAALTGCGVPPAVLAGLSAVASVATPQIAVAVTAAAPVLSEVAKAGCAAQAAANAAAGIAADTHNPAWAARFAEASTLAGMACAW